MKLISGYEYRPLSTELLTPTIKLATALVAPSVGFLSYYCNLLQDGH